MSRLPADIGARAPRCLIIRRDNIGDLVCTTPLLSALRLRYPNAWIGVLANRYNAPVLAGNPDIDAVLAYRKAKHGDINPLALAAERVRIVRDLRRRALDYAVVATPAYQPRAIRLARFLGARQTIAFTQRGEAMRGVDVPISAGEPGELAEAELVFRLAPALGLDGAPPPLKVVPDGAAQARVRAALAERGLAGHAPVIGLHISARKPSQRWPAERFAQLIRLLAHRERVCIALFWAPGGSSNRMHPGDDEKASEVLRAVQGAPVLAWPTSELAELIAGLSVCDQVIAADGGAMHIAAALGRPLVCLFGKSDARRWRPWRVPYELLQAVSQEVEQITVAEVIEAYHRLLSRQPSLHPRSSFSPQ